MPGLRVFRSLRPPFLRRVKIGPSFAKIPLDALLTLTAIRRVLSARYDAIHSHEEGGVIGAALLWLTGRPMAMRIERAGIVTVAGSPLPLVRNMLIFFTKYGLAVAAARNPAERAHLAIWDVAVSGTSAGYFLAWLAVFVIAYRRASQREQFAPQNQ